MTSVTADLPQDMTSEELRAYFQPCMDALEFAGTPPNFPPGHFRAPQNHFVYFIQGAGGAIKIGFTQQRISERLKCIQNGSPVKLVVLALRQASKECERVYHRRFKAHRLHGEWFSPHHDILAEIERLNGGS